MKDKTSFRQDILSHDWVVVGAFTLVMAGFYGAEICFSVFLKPLIAEFGWTRAGVSGSVSTVEGIAGLFGILMGTLTDKYGARILIAIGGILGGLGYLLMSQVSSLWQLYLYFGVMVGMCLAGCWTPIMATVSRLFVGKRILALGIATSGITIGSMIMPPLTAYFIASYGWRPAYLLLAAIVCISAIPGVMLLGRNPPQDSGTRDNGQSIKGGELSGELTQPREHLALESVKTMPFWMLMVIGFATAAVFYFVATHIVAYATDMGIAPTSAALILTFMGAGNILGKLLVWPIATKIGSRSALFVLLILQTFFLFLIMRTTSLWKLFALGSIFGFGYGGSSPLRTAMVPEFFGMKSVGAIIGLTGIAWGIGGITGPFLAGYVFDQSGSYNFAFFYGGLIMIIGMA
ncbi:MAG: MFS transporter, partial [Desulfatiglandales bacterium]|nr:MFS transporter [Desulfatiglandales bacterium]